MSEPRTAAAEAREGEAKLSGKFTPQQFEAIMTLKEQQRDPNDIPTGTSCPIGGEPFELLDMVWEQRPVRDPNGDLRTIMGERFRIEIEHHEW